MKKLLLFINLLPIINNLSFAQPRIDYDKAIPIEKISQPISSVVGWSYNNEYKKWYGYHYLISDAPTQNNKIAAFPTNEHLSSDDENIFAMQTKRVSYQGKKYFLLFITQLDCYFDYPHIFRGRHDYKKKSVFAFTESCFNQIWEVGDSVIKIPVRYLGSCGHSLADYASEKNLLLGNFDGKKLFREMGVLLFFYIKKEDANTYRFQYPSNKNTIEETSPNDIFRDKAIDFSKRYFEIKKNELVKLCIK